MASLVAPLIADNASAASGSVEFYAKGSSTLSTQIYSDADAQTAVTTHTLDANGSIERYVTEPVDVVVLDSDGATIKTFTWVDDARLVNLQNSLATGADPSGNGQTIVAGQTTLHALATLLYTSLGADDGYVLVNGAEALIKNAISTGAGVFLNVVTDYGADSTGVTAADAAFQAAFDAAATAGGGIVYVPHGSYKITGSLTISETVLLLGEGADSTIITQYTSAINGWLAITAADCTIMGIQFARDTTAMTGRVIDTDGRTHIIGCRFNGFNGAHVYLNGASADVRALSCTFTHTEASGNIGTGSTSTPVGHFSDCIFTTSVAGTAFATSTWMLSNCEFGVTTAGCTLFGSGTTATVTGGIIASTTTSGTVTVSAGTLNIAGVNISTGASGTLRLTNSSVVVEAGCIFGSADVVLGTTAAGSRSQARDKRVTASSVGGTSYTPSCEYEVHEVTQTSGASWAFANPSPDGQLGWRLTLIYKNTSGGDLTPTFGTAYTVQAVNLVANNSVTLYEFVRIGTIVDEWIMTSQIGLS